MITCLLEGMLKSSHIHVSYDRIREMTQEKDENPALFLSWLTEAVQKCTNLDVSTPAGLLYLHVQFISRSAPSFHQKLCQLEKGPEAGGIGMGNTCKSMADSCQRMEKITTIL